MERTMKEILLENELLKREIEKYELLLQAVVDAEIWDYSVYDAQPGPEWLAMDKEGYEKIVQALHRFDQLKPWKMTMEKRVEHL